MVPVRAVVAVFVVTENPTAPVPELFAPLVTVIQLSLLTAVHAQAEGEAATVTLPVFAVAGTEVFAEEIVVVQLTP